MLMKHLQIVIKGRVQGVYFRAYTQKKAKQLAIKGTVRNRTDGSVEILAAGEEQYMEKFVQWCHKGPLLAGVTTITQTPMQTHPLYTDFTIIG